MKVDCHGGSHSLQSVNTVVKDVESRDFFIKVPTEELKVWEVFFDNQDQRTNGDGSTLLSRPPPRRSDPLVLISTEMANRQPMAKLEMERWMVRQFCLTSSTRESLENGTFEVKTSHYERTLSSILGGFVIYDSGARENIAGKVME